MTALAFVDTETTGLDPERNEVWEVALILRDEEGLDVEYCWQLPVDLGRADSFALTVGQFYERRSEGYFRSGEFLFEDGLPVPVPQVFRTNEETRRRLSLQMWAGEFAELTHGAHLVGAVPSFDDAFLKPLLRRHGACPGWHYHLVDVEALAAGWIAGHPHNVDIERPLHLPPWNSEQLSLAVGVDPDAFERHSALGDARWARAVYDAVMSDG